MEALKFILIAIFVNIANSAYLKNASEQTQVTEHVITVNKHAVEGSVPLTQIIVRTEPAQDKTKLVVEEISREDNSEDKKPHDEAKPTPVNEVKEEGMPLVTADARQNETPNYFEVIYTQVTTTFTTTFTQIFTTITGYFTSDNRTYLTNEHTAIQEHLKKLQETLKIGLSNLQKSYDEYIMLNKDRDMTAEASRQDEGDADKLKNQLFGLHEMVNEGLRNIEQSLNSVLLAEKETAESGNGQNSVNLEEIIAEFAKRFTQSVQGIEKTMQALKDRLPTSEYSDGGTTHNGVQTNIQHSLETLDLSIKVDDVSTDEAPRRIETN